MRKMFLSQPTYAGVGLKIETRNVELGLRRVGFALTEYLRAQEVFLRRYSQIVFEKKYVYYYVCGGIDSVRLREAVIDVASDVTPLVWLLRFANGRRIPVELLLPHQMAVVENVPTEDHVTDFSAVVPVKPPQPLHMPLHMPLLRAA